MGLKCLIYQITQSYSPPSLQKEFISIATSCPMSERKIQSISEGSEINRTLAAVKAAKTMRAKLRKNINHNRHVSLLIANE